MRKFILDYEYLSQFPPFPKKEQDRKTHEYFISFSQSLNSYFNGIQGVTFTNGNRTNT